MENQALYRVSEDILIIFQVSEEIGWREIRELSISRLLYLSSVLYSFINDKKKNPYSKIYKFDVDVRGPYCEIIDRAIINLRARQFINKDIKNDSYSLNKNYCMNLEKSADYTNRMEWLSAIIYIISVYGEDRIYEFIYRDPEYEDKIQTQSPKGINLNKGNETYVILNKFRQAFEESIDEIKQIKIDPKKYLEMYFEYVFSTILKGEEMSC